MRRLTELPEDAVLVAQRGQEVLLFRIGDTDRGVLMNPRVGTLGEVSVQSALARGYWTEVSDGREPLSFTWVDSGQYGQVDIEPEPEDLLDSTDPGWGDLAESPDRRPRPVNVRGMDRPLGDPKLIEARRRLQGKGPQGPST